MERHGLDTMDKIFDYVTTVSSAFLSLKNQNPFTPFSFRPTLKMRHWELEKSLEKKMKSNQTARFSSKESNIFAIFFVWFITMILITGNSSLELTIGWRLKILLVKRPSLDRLSNPLGSNLKTELLFWPKPELNGWSLLMLVSKTILP